jgi:hypothetical protein
MIEALAFVAGLALAITGSVLAETRRPLPEGSWRWAIPRLTSFRDSHWKQNGYALMLIGSYVSLLYALGDWIGPYALAAAFADDPGSDGGNARRLEVAERQRR